MAVALAIFGGLLPFALGRGVVSNGASAVPHVAVSAPQLDPRSLRDAGSLTSISTSTVPGRDDSRRVDAAVGESAPFAGASADAAPDPFWNLWTSVLTPSEPALPFPVPTRSGSSSSTSRPASAPAPATTTPAATTTAPTTTAPTTTAPTTTAPETTAPETTTSEATTTPDETTTAPESSEAASPTD
jgi:hypothetical protein